jgi:hypothetical protein
VTVRPYREDPSIRIRDESLASLGFKTLSVQALVKQMQNVKFQRFILSSQHNTMSVFSKAGASGSSADTIVINNENGKW